MPRRNSRSVEASHQDTVLDWLALKGILAFRMNSGFHVAVDEKTGKRRAIRYGVVGMADIVAFPWFPGEMFPRTLWIEMKRPKGVGQRAGKQTPEQESFQQQVEEAGLHYMVARNVEDVEQWLTKLNNSIRSRLRDITERETVTKS